MLGTGSGSHCRKANPNSQDPVELVKRVCELELGKRVSKNGGFLRQGAVDKYCFGLIYCFNEDGYTKPMRLSANCGQPQT